MRLKQTKIPLVALKRPALFFPINASLYSGLLITSQNDIQNMCVFFTDALEHHLTVFFCNEFYKQVFHSVRKVFIFYDHLGVLCEPSQDKVSVNVLSKPKSGVSGVEIDYEHIRIADLEICLSSWKLFLKTFHCKRCKSRNNFNSKEKYRGIKLFPTLYEIYWINLLEEVEKEQARNRFFSNCQFVL